MTGDDEAAERRRRTLIHLAVRPLTDRPYPYPRKGEAVEDFAKRAGVDETALLDQIQRGPS